MLAINRGITLPFIYISRNIICVHCTNKILDLELLPRRRMYFIANLFRYSDKNTSAMCPCLWLVQLPLRRSTVCTLCPLSSEDAIQIFEQEFFYVGRWHIFAFLTQNKHTAREVGGRSKLICIIIPRQWLKVLELWINIPAMQEAWFGFGSQGFFSIRLSLKTLKHR